MRNIFTGFRGFIINIEAGSCQEAAAHTAWKPLSSFRPSMLESLLRAKHQAWGVCPVLAVELYGFGEGLLAPLFGGRIKPSV